ncbi:MAG: LytTR family DNA-binding domain-containing protein [Clostridiales bacterium]|jgi:DNA-binding LytR/AlgR family response regulator|nr:LytTR family DNA-binding domain-containing protein [Clostridiales bacterium]
MLNVFICDEHRDDANTLINTIKKLKPNIRVAGVTPTQLENYNFDSGPSVIILELVFERRSGLEFARRLRRRALNAYIIFVTAHVELTLYLLAGNIVPAGLIRKPLHQSEVEKVVNNVLTLCKEAGDVQYLTVNISAELIKVPYKDILYLEAFEKKIYVHTKAKRYGYYNTLTSLAEELKEPFVRCHNSFIVNGKWVKEVNLHDMLIIMENGAQLPVSRGFRHDVAERLADK